MKSIVVIGQVADVFQRLHDVVNFQIPQDVACNGCVIRDFPVVLAIPEYGKLIQALRSAVAVRAADDAGPVSVFKVELVMFRPVEVVFPFVTRLESSELHVIRHLDSAFSV